MKTIELMRAMPKERMSVFDTLLSSPKIDANVKFDQHYIQYASKEGGILIPELTERGADLSLRNSKEQRVLQLACRGRDYTSVEVFLTTEQTYHTQVMIA